MSHTTVKEAGILITINEDKGSTYYDEELAKDLVALWGIRHMLTPEQKERIHAITQEKYI
jgi:hypothetical protein